MASHVSRQIVPRVQQTTGFAGRMADVSRPRTFGAFLKDITSPFLFGWRPVLREPVEDTIEAWEAATAKTIDTMHNSGWLAGGVDTATYQMIGTGLDLDLKPEIGILGQGTNTEEWARGVVARFTAWASDPWSCDAGGRYTLGQLAAQAVRQYFATGEIVGTMPIIYREGSTHGTKIRVLPSTRLSQASAVFRRAVQGVVLDENGAPAGYIFHDVDETRRVVGEKLVAARDVRGRPAVIHILDAAPTATRGITPLAPALKVLRQYDQLSDATLAAAMIQAIFAASVESAAPTNEILQALQNEDEQEAEVQAPGAFTNFMSKRFEWYTGSKFDFGSHGKVVHTFPGETLKFHRSEHPNGEYLNFSKNLLREVSRCLGVTYEQFTNDYVGATYSSVRMAVADMWLVNLYRRANLAGRFYQMAFEAFLEEEILAGLTPFPGGIEAYYARRARVAAAYWRGPARPTADDLKTAKAQQIQRQEGWTSTEQLAAEYGNDHRDVIASQKVTNERREDAGLAPLGGVTDVTGSVPGAEDDGLGAPGGSGRGVDARRLRDRNLAIAARNRDDRLVRALMDDNDAAVEAVLMEEVESGGL